MARYRKPLAIVAMQRHIFTSSGWTKTSTSMTLIYKDGQTFHTGHVESASTPSTALEQVFHNLQHANMLRGAEVRGPSRSREMLHTYCTRMGIALVVETARVGKAGDL